VSEPPAGVPAAPAQAEPQAAPAVLLIRPRHFAHNAETAGSNRFQSSVSAAAQAADAARRELLRLVVALGEHGVAVHVLEGRDAPECPDEVFPNNWFSTHADGTLVLYPMMAPSRRQERRSGFAATLRGLGFAVRRVVDLSDLEQQGLYLEGTGSLVLDRSARIAYVCRSARTSAEAVRTFADRLNYEALVFEAADRGGHPIYHTNVLMSVGSEFAVVCAQAIIGGATRRAVLDRLRGSGKRVIEIGYAQLHAFAGNLLEVRGSRGAVIALSRRALASLEPAQRAALAEHGALATAAIDTIEACGGGSVRCMLAELHLPRASGDGAS
jgi:hypothetical protein